MIISAFEALFFRFSYWLLKAFAPVVLLARGFPLSRCRADSCGIGLASGNAG
jgi:hypothetical protein